MSDRDLEPTRRRIREWTRREPGLPAPLAGTRVLNRLDDRRPEAGRLPVAGHWVAALAAGGALAAALVLTVGISRPPATGLGASAAPTAEPLPAPSDALVYELTSGTRLYILLEPRAPAKTGETT